MVMEYGPSFDLWTVGPSVYQELANFFSTEFLGVSDPIYCYARQIVICPMDRQCHRWLHLQIF